MKHRLFRLAAGALRLLARPLLWIGTLAVPVLALARWFEVRSIRPPAGSDRPREWLPRLWERGHAPDQTEPPR